MSSQFFIFTKNIQTMKKQLLLLLITLLSLTFNKMYSQCANTGTLVAGSLTPPGVGLTASASYGAGQYVTAFVSAGANYTVSTCGASAYDTQLTVYNDGTGTFLAYNDDFCGLQSSTSFTATTCGYVRVLLSQYSCNSSGAIATVNMTMNTAGNVPSITTAMNDTTTCSGVPVTIGNASPTAGGTAPYTYSWLATSGLSSTTASPTIATVTTATTYTLTVTDANNCSATDDIHINITPVPVINLGADTSHCVGTTLTLNAGNVGSTYLWNDASTAQTLLTSTTGTYYVTVTTPAGCFATDSINVTLNALPVVNLGNDSIQCGGSILLDAGNAGASYVWNDASTAQTLSVSATGTYSVTVTNTSTTCSSSDLINISIDPLPVVNLGIDSAQCGGSILLDAGNPGEIFLWSDASAAQTLLVNSSGNYYVTVTNTSSCSTTDSINITINSLPVVNLGNDSTQCEGSIVLDAGNAGLNYLWNDASTAQTLTATTSGTYSVAVTNAGTGCSTNDTVQITINPIPVVNLGSDSVQCGGSILLDAGNAGATYTWSNLSTAQTLAATSTGTYAVAVQNSFGCLAVDSVNITINPLPIVNLGNDTAQCGGTITLDAGNPGLNYQWNTTSTSQTITIGGSALISVLVTNPTTGCLANDSINITILQLPVVNLGSDTTQCAGTVLLNAGNVGATFLWNDGSSLQTLNVSTNGNYYVTVSNALGCSTTDTILVTINPLPVVGFVAFPSAVCTQSAAFTLTGGSPAGGVYSGTGVTGSTFDPATAGVGTHPLTYTITSATTGCVNSSSQNILINDCTGIEESLLENSLSIYPNPATEMVNLNITNVNSSAISIVIMDMQGKVVYSISEKTNAAAYNKQVNISELAKGFYYIKVATETETTTKKLIVQ